MTGKKGQTIRIRYAEELYRLGDRKGQIYTDNLRKAKATDTYTFARNETVTYQPTFTQHGFRYIEITGVDTPPATNDVQGVVLGSDLPDIGDLHLSNPMLNQLVSNIRWGQRGNFLSIPTDTPARDERLGWTGDISVFSPTACRYRDTRAFLSKWMDDMRDAQKPDGNIPAIVPQPRHEFDQTGVGWSDAFITVPYAVWHATGDTRIVRRNWEAMKRFYGFVHDSATQGRQPARRRAQFLVLRRLAVFGERQLPTPRRTQGHRHGVFCREHPHDGRDGGGVGRDESSGGMGGAGSENPRGVCRRVSSAGRFDLHRHADRLRDDARHGYDCRSGSARADRRQIRRKARGG